MSLPAVEMMMKFSKDSHLRCAADADEDANLWKMMLGSRRSSSPLPS